MKIKNLHEVKKEEVPKRTVPAWNLFTEQDFQSGILLFNDNLVESGATTEPHEHQDMEEVYYIVSGKGKAKIGNEDFP